MDEAWVCLGDFNEMLSIDEKGGGHQRPERQMQQFRDALDDYGLMDSRYRGPKFTWFRRNGEEAGIFERLDRGVANSAWINTFHEGYIQHLTVASSDHRPIFLRTKNETKGGIVHFSLNRCGWVQKDAKMLLEIHGMRRKELEIWKTLLSLFSYVLGI